MANEPTQFEYSDNLGSTVVYGGPSGIATGDWTTSIKNIPSVAGAIISQVGIRTDNPSPGSFECSFDGGTTYVTVGKEEFMYVDVKGSIRQLLTRSTTGTINQAEVHVLINFEVT